MESTNYTISCKQKINSGQTNVGLDSRASTDSPFLGTGSDKVKGQPDTFLTAGSVLYTCSGMVLLTTNAGMSSAVKICHEI